MDGCVCVLQNNGAQQLASEATVYIMLEDVNDEIPLFTEREQETVLEGEPIGTKVTQVNAIDKDGTFPNNQVSFFSVCPVSIGAKSSPNRKEKCTCRRSGPQPNQRLGSIEALLSVRSSAKRLRTNCLRQATAKNVFPVSRALPLLTKNDRKI